MYIVEIADTEAADGQRQMAAVNTRELAGIVGDAFQTAFPEYAVELWKGTDLLAVRLCGEWMPIAD